MKKLYQNHSSHNLTTSIKASPSLFGPFLLLMNSFIPIIIPVPFQILLSFTVPAIFVLIIPTWLGLLAVFFKRTACRVFLEVILDLKWVGCRFLESLVVSAALWIEHALALLSRRTEAIGSWHCSGPFLSRVPCYEFMLLFETRLILFPLIHLLFDILNLFIDHFILAFDVSLLVLQFKDFHFQQLNHSVFVLLFLLLLFVAFLLFGQLVDVLYVGRFGLLHEIVEGLHLGGGFYAF